MTWNAACPKCLEPVSAGARFCARCGSDVSGPQGSLTTVEVARQSAIGRDTSAEILETLRRATLGDYDIVGELGRGGMAIVYLAHDIALDRKVAIKVMHPALLLGPGMTERFKREARTAAALTHPHIIPIHIVRETEKLLYFVMKYVEGRSLDSILAETGALPIKMVRTILAQVGTALEYAHRRGVVHRDVKPANIMIDTEGWVIVTDFGIAKVAEAGNLTISGTAIGTPSYMSPEQCSARPVTGASDQYSLGIVGFEMLSGRPPFVGDSLMDLMRMHFFETPPPVSTVRQDCPPPLAAAIDRMLSKEPQQRWPSIEDGIAAAGSETLARDDPVRTHMVELAKTGIKRVARISTPVSPSPVRSAEPRRESRPGRRLCKALILGIVAAAAAGGAWLAYRSLAPGQDPVAVVEIAGAPATLDEGQQAENQPTGPAPQVTDSNPPMPHERRVVSVSVSPIAPTIIVGDSQMLIATATDSSGQSLDRRRFRWASRNQRVASVSARGVVVGVAPGRATITATADDGASGTATVTVARPADGVLRVSVSHRANFTVDGNSQGQNDRFEVRVSSRQRHTLRFEQNGFVTFDTTVMLQPGVSLPLRVDMRPVAPVPGVLLQILFSQYVFLSIDGILIGERNRWSDTLSAGTHRLRFERDGYVTMDTTVTLEPGGKPQLMRVNLQRRSP